MKKLNAIKQDIKKLLSCKGIYKIINNISKKFYVGSTTTNFYYRLDSHLKSLRKKCHGNIILQNSYNKHGEDVFYYSIEILNDDNKSFLITKYCTI